VQHAFIWENGSMIDLDSLIPADSGILRIQIREPLGRQSA
jgi:hypothetical protein